MIARLLAPCLLATLLTVACKPDAAGRSGSSAAASSAWVDPAQLRPGPIRHETLTPAQIDRIRALQKTFAEVDDSSLEKWVDDFKRDRHPDREIAIYEAMAKAFASYCAAHTLTPEARREVYALVLLRSGAPEDDVLQNARLEHLSRDEARQVLRGYAAPPQPIEVQR